ncbi:MAG: hypothetical protein GWN56_11380, partial [Nitrosopumilaceae archaeon]|nr:hypothetical protein [Nitrosopumilaceae archaeon]
WRIKNTIDADIQIDDVNKYSGAYSLMVGFSGKKNINFHHVSKYIPVKADTKYSLSYNYMSKNITTKSGVYWELRCNKSRLNTRTDAIIGSNSWKKDVLVFETNNECDDGINLILRRNPIKKLDSKISGTLWLDNVRLEALN